MRTCSCGHPRVNKGPDAKDTLTSVGIVTLERRFFACGHCQLNGYAIDDSLGGDGYLSRRLLRLACSQVSQASFRVSKHHLDENFGIKVAAETLRVYCEAEAKAMSDWQTRLPEVGTHFAAAFGNVEFQMDGGMVNTLGGWREFKVCSLAKRPAADAATAAEWDSRVLLATTARVVYAAFEPIEVFEQHLRPLTIFLGITNTEAIQAWETALNGSGTQSSVGSQDVCKRSIFTTAAITSVTPAKRCIPTRTKARQRRPNPRQQRPASRQR